MQKLVEDFIRTTNASDVDGAMSLFAANAVIDDVSVGYALVGIEGVRRYLERFFVGYNSRSKFCLWQTSTNSMRWFAWISQVTSATRSAPSKLRQIQPA